MKKLTIALMLLICPFAASHAQKNAELAPGLKGYFKTMEGATATPDDQGFIRRWMLLEPISKPNSSNRVLTDSYVRENLTKQYFKKQGILDLKKLPKDGDKETIEMQVQAPVNLNQGRPRGQQDNTPKMEKVKLQWHALDSELFNIKLFRFATGLDKTRYGVIFWGYTIVECDQDMENVRLAVGTNKGSIWYVNGEELIMLASDRHMNVDSAVSKRITLKKGKNIVWFGLINGPSMSDFCCRFLDEDGNPIKNLKISVNQ